MSRTSTGSRPNRPHAGAPSRHRTRLRRLAGNAAILVLVVAGAAAAPAAEADVAAPDTMVSGAVTKDGRAVAGARVVAYAWPSQAVLDHLQEGDRVDTAVLGSDSSDARGHFAIVVEPTKVAGAYLDDQGQVDVQLVVTDEGDELVWDFSAVRVEAAAATPLGKGGRNGGDRNGTSSRPSWANPRLGVDAVAGADGSATGPTHLFVEMGPQPRVTELGDDPSTWVDEDGEELGADGAAAAVAVGLHRSNLDGSESDEVTVQGPNTCNWIATNTYYSNLDQRFVNKIGVTQAKPWINQTVGASHTLGVAYKAGTTSSWSQSGTLTRTTSAGAETHRGYTVGVRNKTNYRRYVHECVSGREQRRPHSVHSLNSSHVVISRPSWTGNGCATYTNGTYWKSSGSNVNFSSGVNVGVISVSSRATFTSSMRLKWVFSARARLCGSNTLGWVSAPQAGAYVP